MTPFDDFVYLINHVLLGEEPTIEDFILLVGTLVAFIAFILWCCFPIQPKEPGQHRQFTCKIIQNHIKAFDAATSTDNDNDNGTAATATNCGSNSNSNNNSGNNSGNNVAAANGNIANGSNGNNLSNNSNNSQYNGSYSKNGTVAMHNYYVKNGHHCCT
ncbi:putative uncharacterized protein DDB_G0287599 isoform X1 [Drosophila innubila]|uniref:putative uncharacterized protein DDB_G0287599 isoform X1 n=1 Tax=Drosophila innubila TaxID=198719 RepID=UPI00148CA255|nr:putative uncharacterized protein DDB_G0287599 isoform X1 [Drosophila innubila]